MKTEKNQNRYLGMTKKQYKKFKAKSNSTPGKEKCLLCQTTGLTKAMIKYPRSYKTNPIAYFNINLQRDLLAHRHSFFTVNQ